MICVVTIEREYGSGAAAIAQAVASELGFTLWDRDINQEIARRVQCDVKAVERLESRPDPVYHRLVRAFMRGSFEGSLSTSNLEVLDSERLAQLFTTVITDIAAKGRCVIIGRGAPYFLRDRTDTFNVFLYTSHAEKTRRTLAQGVSPAETENLLQTVDRDRAAFVKKYYGKDWPDRNLYHLMINTKVGDAVAVRTILDEIELLDICSKSKAQST